MSQVTDCIIEQSDPFGQQRTAVFAAKGMHVESVGQQKLSGKPAWEHFEKPSAAHVDSDCRWNSWLAGMAETVVALKATSSSSELACCSSRRGPGIVNMDSSRAVLSSQVGVGYVLGLLCRLQSRRLERWVGTLTCNRQRGEREQRQRIIRELELSCAKDDFVATTMRLRVLTRGRMRSRSPRIMTNKEKG